MSTDLSVIKGNFIELRREPSDVLDDARKAAKALTTVIDQKPHKVMIKGKVYLEYEDWQTVAQFYGYTVRTGGSEPTEINGVKGAKANAELIDFTTGIVVGGAEAYCMSDEENWGNKPWFQLASMAQTRAGSKAIRNRMAWVVVLAGYAGTPAEEVTEDMKPEPNKSEHYCELHGVNYFMKGKMTSWGHPLKDENGNDTGEWCHEHKEKPKDEIGAQAKTKPKAEQASPATVEDKKMSREELLNLVAEAKGWTSAKTVPSFLVNACKIPEERINSDPKGVWEEVKTLL